MNYSITFVLQFLFMPIATNSNNPQVAIDLDLLDREQAAEYLGYGIEYFRTVAKQLKGVNIGQKKFYSKETLQDFMRSKIANAQN